VSGEFRAFAAHGFFFLSAAYSPREGSYRQGFPKAQLFLRSVKEIKKTAVYVM
jgi:hypothetical protein